MKRILLTLITLLCVALAGHAQDGRSIYNRYSDEPGISSVYISPAMFRLIGRIPSIDTGDGDVDLSPIIRSLNGLYIINSSDPAVNAKLRTDVETFLHRGRFELLMEAKEDGEAVRMYTKGTDEIISSFILFSSEPGDCTFITFDGQIGREEFEKTVSKIIQ